MLRIGVVGYGTRSSGVINKAFRQVEPDIRVVGVVDPDEAGVRERLAECDKKDVLFYKNLKEMVSRAKLDGLLSERAVTSIRLMPSKQPSTTFHSIWKNPWPTLWNRL